MSADDEQLTEATFKKYRKQKIKTTENICKNLINVQSAVMMEEKLNEMFDSKGGISDDLQGVVDFQKEVEKQGEMDFFAKVFMEQLGIADEDPDPYGDGNQSQLYGMNAFKLQAQWATGFNYNPETNRKLTDWSKACFYGKHEEVAIYLDKITDCEERKKLLEARESMIRFCGLFHVIAGARMHPSDKHIEVIKLLLAAGASVNIKDVAGYTPLHHCLTKYGNSTTLEIAKCLLEANANVNAVNRFGCTALFEPCMNCDYDAIELLISNGCDMRIKENNGLSCHTFANHNPKIRSIFSKSYRTKAKLDKKKTAPEYTSCALCEIVGSLKRCTGCLAVAYCSQSCQKNHWKTHKAACKEMQNENKDQIVKVSPVSNPYKNVLGADQQYFLYNEKSKTLRGKKNSAKKKHIENEKAMKVKIQVSLGGDGPADGPMLVYDRSRSYEMYITSTDVSYKKVFDAVVEQGYGGVKAYFGATLKKNGDLHINLSRTFTETW